MLALAVAYPHLRDLRVVAGLCFGVRVVALATVVHALAASAGATLRDRRLAAIAAGACLAAYGFAVPLPWVVAAAAAAGLAVGVRAPARGLAGGVGDAPAPAPIAFARAAQELAIGLGAWIAPLVILAAVLGPQHALVRGGGFFATAALVGVGGGHAVLAYAAQSPDGAPPWVAPGELLDGMGLALAVPGASIDVVPFLGFLGARRSATSLPSLLAGVAGAVIATWATCGPALLWRLRAAPHLAALRGRQRVQAALSAGRAALLGASFGLALWLASHVLFAGVRIWYGPLGARVVLPRWWSLDLSALALTVAACAALLRWRWSPRATLLACAGLGLVLRWALGVL